MNIEERWSTVRERLRETLWIAPSAAVVVALLGGVWLGSFSLGSSAYNALLFGGGPDAARGILQVTAGSVLGVASVTFSLTILALQLTASQYSPRLLSSFLRDRGNKIVLSIFLGTFAFAMVVLRTVRDSNDSGGAFVPDLAVTVALLLGLASTAALVYFIDHISQSIRIDQLMTRVQGYTLAAMDKNPAGEGVHYQEQRQLEPPVHAKTLGAHRSGYLQTAGVDSLVKLASELDVVFLYRRALGEHVTAGTALAWVWAEDERSLDLDRATRAVNDALALGPQRTMQEDIAYGLRQLVDIAVKALSPGVNDPTTATDAIGHLSVLLAEIAQRPTGARAHTDNETPRVVIPAPSFADYLAIACTQIARYGADDVTVMRRLLRLLEDVAGLVCDDPERRNAVEREIERAISEADLTLDREDYKASLRAAAQTARNALAGDLSPSHVLTL